MKITSNSIEALSSGTAAALDANTAPSAAASKRAKSDSVNLSQANQLVKLAKASSSAARADKLASIGAAVRSGSYKTDTAEVSQAVVQGHLQ